MQSIEDALNPFHKLFNDCMEDDLIIVKLDIDTLAIEISLVYQCLNDTPLHKLIDHFYFEHHVMLGGYFTLVRAQACG